MYTLQQGTTTQVQQKSIPIFLTLHPKKRFQQMPHTFFHFLTGFCKVNKT